MSTVLATPATEPVVLTDVEVLLATFEQSGARGDALLPAGLVPTIPTLVSFLVVRVPDGPFGAFTSVEVRLSCRSGPRARALVVGQAIDGSAQAVEALGAGWGLGGELRSVRLRRGYDAVEAVTDGLRVSLLDPAPIGAHDVQFVTGLVPVTTNGGEQRLAQVELDIEPSRVERGRPVLAEWDGARWGQPLLRPTHPVAAVLAVGIWTLPPIRFLLNPDLPPHLGTEPAL